MPNRKQNGSRARYRFPLRAVVFVLLLILPSPRLLGSEKERKENYGFGFAVDLTIPEDEVLDALEQVLGDGIIQGSKEYSKDQYIEKAASADSSPLFPKWTGPERFFTKSACKHWLH